MKRPTTEQINGVLIIDKPAGMTSHDVVRRVRRALKIRRVGHAGTLDPMATGIVQVAVGEATRIVEFLMEGRKTYRALVRLGETTDTQDAEGRLLERREVGEISPDRIEAACRSFTGPILQVPPMYSALKKDGVSLHRLARQGIEVERQAREVQIHRLEVLAIDLPFFQLEVECSKGTYIRTLAHDLGAVLGPGAHLAALRRVRSGSFTEADCLLLEDLENCSDLDAGCPGLLSIREALNHFPSLALDGPAAARLRHGVPPERSEIEGNLPVEGENVLLLGGDALLAIARFAPERRREKRGDFELLRVFPTAPAD